MLHPNALDEQLENLRTLQQSYDQIAGAAEAYNVGKTQLAQAITAKGVATDPTETYPEMAEKVNAISQETYEINGGEMYAKQLFGSLETPNYWNLYEIMAQLLSDGRLVSYGGILLAEYYKGYDSLALSGVGAGGAYVVSDKDSDGNFIMYTDDTTHTWDEEWDGKCNRWVAYCFADAGHDFDITDTNTSPRCVHIGRNVGYIKLLTDSRISDVIVTDGNTLAGIVNNGYLSNYGKRLVLNNLKEQTDSAFIIPTNSVTESVYIQADKIDCASNVAIIKSIGGINPTINNIIIKSPYASAVVFGNGYARTWTVKFIYFDGIEYGRLSIVDNNHYYDLSSLQNIFLTGAEDVIFKGRNDGGATHPALHIYIGYKTNDKTKSIRFTDDFGSDSWWDGTIDVELQDGWCKPLDVHLMPALTKQNVQDHIFDRLGVNDLSTGSVTVTLATAVLNLFTQEEIDAVVARTNITIVGA